MADPTIQTFCCHRPMSSNPSEILSVFNTNSYNTVCLVSSSIGMLGAIYQILPREKLTVAHRWYTVSSSRGRHIVVWLAVADLFAALGVFLRSILWLNYHSYMYNESNVIFCALFSAWIQYFYTATWLWTLCYAIDMRFVLKEQQGYPICYHLLVWCTPAALTSIGLSILYYPDANCEDLGSLSSALFKVLPNYTFTYIPIIAVMIVNPVLYFLLSNDVELMIVRSLAQFTNKERQIVDAIKLKFSLINLVFYICWLPNIINGFVVWTLWFSLPQKFIITLWYIMAVTNPLQAFFNSFVYRRWTGATERLYLPCRNVNEVTKVNSNSSGGGGKIVSANESTPLMSSSINSSTHDSDADVEDNNFEL